MSTKLVREEIAKFLARSMPEALCIRGKWGVGKTFAWGKALEAAQADERVALKSYSYVSLFGVNSLDELKFAIFENVTSLDGGVKKADLSTLEAHIAKLGDWRRFTRIAQSLPFIKNFVGSDATGLVAFMSIKDQIVCIDDLERKGKSLEVSDVLGLISYLREQRNCKVILILNDEQLSEDAKKSFDKHLEKVVDASLVYQPTALEAAKIGFPEQDELSKDLAERCTSLGITNIRVMKRIIRFAKDLQPLLQEYEKDVAIATRVALVLFCWANDQPEEAPSIDFLKSKSIDQFGLGENNEVQPKEAAWHALLESYGYTWTDEFDLEILRSIQRGFFDPDEIKKYASALSAKVQATKADGSFEQAWRLYHDSFANNKDEVLDTLHASFMKNYMYITPTNLNGTVRLFKELGRPDQAAEMLAHYMANRNEEREFYDLREDHFGSITDPDVRAAFEAKYAQTEEKRDIRTILINLKDGWRDDDLSALASMPVSEYKKKFEETSGQELRRILSGVFQFDRIVNATPQMLEIAKRARLALREIGGESDINRRRVKRFGVNLDDPDTAGPEARPE
jgi:hypothetical protein